MSRLVFVAGTCLGLSLSFSAPACADSEGFIDRWQGHIVSEYVLKNNPPIVVAPGINLSETFEQVWNTGPNPKDPQSSARVQVCNAFADQIKGMANDFSCVLPASGELKGKMSGSGTILYLKYIVAGGAASFELTTGTVLGRPANPDIRMTFDTEIDVALLFESEVDGQTNATRPISVVSSTIGFHNAHAETSFLFAPESKLREAESILDSTVRQIPPLDLTTMNQRTHDGANAIAAALNGGSFGGFPGANSYFQFSAAIDANQDLAIGFRKNGDPTSAPADIRIEDQLCDFDVFVGSDRSENATSYFLRNVDPTIVGPGAGAEDSDSGVKINLAAGDHEGVFTFCALNLWSSSCSSPFAVEAKHGPCPRGSSREPPVGSTAGCVKKYIWDFCPPVLASPP